MSSIQKFTRFSRLAICAASFSWACASSTAAPKEPKTESASGSAQDTASDSTSTKDKSDMPEDNVGNDPAGPGQSKSDDTKTKTDEAKKSGVAPKDDSRTTAAIQEIIKVNRSKFKKCYEDEHKKVKDLKGTVVLELTLDADGKIKKSGTNAEESTIKVKAVSDCIVKVAESLTYPASSKGLDKDFRYEFGFENH